MVTQHLGLVRQVVGIDTDAVPTDQSGLELQKVPFGPGRFEHLAGVQPQAVEDDGQFVHQRDVEVSLGVLDHLGGFGGLDAAGAMHAWHDDLLVELCHLGQRLGRITRDDLQNLGQRVVFVTRVDALR